MRKPKPRPVGPRTIPSVVQLPGGITLQGLQFKVIERNEDGSPKTFELLPKGTKPTPGPDMFVLFASEEQIRRPS